jgi:hypothetical protein
VKGFHNALDKSDRKKFDEMFDIPKFYISAINIITGQILATFPSGGIEPHQIVSKIS